MAVYGLAGVTFNAAPSAALAPVSALYYASMDAYLRASGVVVAGYAVSLQAQAHPLDHVVLLVRDGG